MVKTGQKFIISDSILGDISVEIKEVIGETVRYENSILNHSGMCHLSVFKKMIKK